jgi:hypothetical protein
MTSTEPRRLAVVVARHSARSGAPPGIEADAFARACLVDSYEVLADLLEVTSGIASTDARDQELLWPGSVQLDGSLTLQHLAGQLQGHWDEVVFVPGDVPDLPGLVLAKIFKALQRADVCVAPERGQGQGCAALGVRLPWPAWITGELDLDLDRDPLLELRSRSPHRTAVAVAPDWHRLRTPAAVQRLDPGLEGWDATRALLGGHVLAVE